MKQPIQILSTRIIEEKHIMQAKNNGIEILNIPFIQTTPITSTAIKTKIITIAATTSNVIFTSVNAIKAVKQYLTAIPNWQIFTISGATKDYAIKTFGKKSIVDSANNGALLADKIVQRKEIKNCIFFCGNKRLGAIPNTIAKHKIMLEEIAVYQTELTPQVIHQSFQAVIFYSPSAVKSFFSVNKLPTEVLIFSIGTTTTDCIKQYTNNKVITNVVPTTECILNNIKEFFIPKI